MKFWLVVAALFSGSLCLCAQSTALRSASGSGAQGSFRTSPIVRSLLKEKILFERRQSYLAANFAFTRATLPALTGMVGDLQRTTQYAIPLLYGRRLDRGDTPQRVSLEFGAYAGLLRLQQVGNMIFPNENELMPPCQSSLTLGWLAGLSFGFADQLHMKIRYRGGSAHTIADDWGKVQVGWSFTF